MKRYILIFCLVFFAIFVPLFHLKADVITYSGCFEKARINNSLNIRMQGLDCNIIISGGSGQIYSFTIENIDPDAFNINTYNSGSRTSSTNILGFQSTITSDPQIISLTPWYEPADDFYFVSLSDTQPNSSTNLVATHFEDFLNYINVINPYFTTHSGDLIDGSSDQATRTSMFQAFDDAIATSETPFFTVPGNHDDDESTNLSIYESFFSTADYSFDFSNTHFSMISTVSPSTSSGHVSDETKSWLSSDLSGAVLPNKIACFHHPLYFQDYSVYQDPDDRNELASILDDNKIDLISTGHYHNYDYTLLDSTKIPVLTSSFYQLINGGAGDRVTDAGFYHFVLHHVQGDQITHEIVRYNSFYLSKEYLNLNDGSEESSAIRIYNDGISDWNWLRLKYKIAPAVNNIYAFDDLGNYLTFHEKLLDTYHVIYLDTNIPALTNKTITVAKKTKIHTERLNFISSSGEASYSEEPINASTETSLSAIPTNDAIAVNIITWNKDGDYQKKWTVAANNANDSIDFTIGDLAPDYLYQLKINDKLYYKYYPDSSGLINFNYQLQGENYSFELIRENTWLPNNLAVMPNGNGGPQVRIFNQDGEAENQFYAYDQSWQGGYNVLQSDLNGDRVGEIIVSPQANLTPQIKIYDQDENLLASKKVFTHDHKVGLNIKTADLSGDGLPEIIVSPQNSSDNKIRVYRYSLTTGKIKLVTTKKFYNTSQAGGINIETKDINNDFKDEVIASFSTNNGPLKIYNYNKKRLNLITQENIDQAIITGIAAGNIDNKGNAEIALTTVDKEEKNVLLIYRLKKERLELIKQKKFKIQNFSGFHAKMADLTGDFKDEIILSPLNSAAEIKIYTYNKTKVIKILDKISPFGDYNLSGINIGLIDFDNDWDVELVTAPITGSSKINIYNYISGKISKTIGFTGFTADFTGGVAL